MRRHETPRSVATALARHAPKQIHRILDPSVGNGILLEPFLRRLIDERCQIYAIDSDSRPLKKVRKTFPKSERLEIIHSDFLKWAPDYLQRKPKQLFDCIVMNPPFAARRQKWSSLRIASEKSFEKHKFPSTCPIEARFVINAISLLAPKGRLLAVLPASLISSPTLGWIREFLNEYGRIHHVHELPKFTFPKIESRIYLLVFEKNCRNGNTFLLNHDLVRPERMLFKATNPKERLDFAFHKAQKKLAALKSRSLYQWKTLTEIAFVRRGTEKTPNNDKSIVHTCDHSEGFWSKSGIQAGKLLLRQEDRIEIGDLLVKRVSRNCAASFGTAAGLERCLCSDCILILRPKANIASIRLLFAVRCIMAFEFGPFLLERGTGASYIVQNELSDFWIPYGLSEIFPKEFKCYSNAIQDKNHSGMRRIEMAVANKMLNRRTKGLSL